MGLPNYWWDESHQYLTLVGLSPGVPLKITPMLLKVYYTIIKSLIRNFYDTQIKVHKLWLNQLDVTPAVVFKEIL